MTKIMLAEDDPTMVSLLTTLLKMDGLEAVALDADDDVPAAVAREHPDVLLLDVFLSKQNGLEVLDVLRGEKENRNIRIVMTSGLDLKEECLRRGANDFLLKPYMPDDLIQAIRRNIKPQREP